MRCPRLALLFAITLAGCRARSLEISNVEGASIEAGSYDLERVSYLKFPYASAVRIIVEGDEEASFCRILTVAFCDGDAGERLTANPITDGESFVRACDDPERTPRSIDVEMVDSCTRNPQYWSLESVEGELELIGDEVHIQIGGAMQPHLGSDGTFDLDLDVVAAPPDEKPSPFGSGNAAAAPGGARR